MKRPLEGPIFPGDEPEPSEAQFRADWARLQEAVGLVYGENAEPKFDEDEPLASVRRAELIEQFVKRYPRRVKAAGMSPGQFLEQAAALRATVLRTHQEVEIAEERVLQAQSDLADHAVKSTEFIFLAAAQIKAKWPTMSEAERAQARPILEDYEQNREEWLSDLPIDERRRLEKQFPE